jgi:hypothetical protein
VCCSCLLVQTKDESVPSPCNDEISTIDNLLNRLGLDDFRDVFKREQIDIDALVSSAFC